MSQKKNMAGLLKIENLILSKINVSYSHGLIFDDITILTVTIETVDYFVN